MSGLHPKTDDGLSWSSHDGLFDRGQLTKDSLELYQSFSSEPICHIIECRFECWFRPTRFAIKSRLYDARAARLQYF